MGIGKYVGYRIYRTK